MATKKKLTFALMDPPFENARTVTTMRLIDIAARRGHEIIVFAYEGAVGHAFAKQAKHANAAHGHDLAQEDHPLARDRGRARHSRAWPASRRRVPPRPRRRTR